jgi:hypothetical protein
MSKYADVIKNATDLLSKSYSYSNTVELKTSTPNGVKYTAKATVSKPAKTSVEAEFASGSFKVDKLGVGSDKKIVGEFSFAEVIPNTKLSLKTADGSRAAGADALKAVIGLERKDKTSFVTLDVDALSYGVDTTAVVNYNGFLVGGAASAKLAKAGGVALDDYNVLLGWTDASTTVAVKTSKKLTEVTAGYHQVVSSTISTAAVAKFPLAAAPADKFDVELGLAYKAAADTTVNAKVSSSGRVAVSYAQVVSPLTKITFAGEVDAADIGSDNHKFGVLLNLTA